MSKNATVLRIGILAATLVPAIVLQAGITEYFDQPSWLAAVGGGTNGLTVFSFDGSTETTGEYANSADIVPSYSSQGVDFLPFIGTTVYPVIARNQQFQISSPNHDGLLTDTSSPNPAGDLEGRAIRFTFNIPSRSVGLNFNGPLNGGDLGYLEAFDYSGNLIGQTDNSAAGGFVGLVADTEIYEVHVINTYSLDYLYGIWDLQFKESPVTLQIQPTNSAVVLSWPATAGSFVPQSANDISTTNWQTVPGTPLIVSNSWILGVGISNNIQFFRLQQP